MGEIVGGHANRKVQKRNVRKDAFSKAKKKLFLNRLAATANVTMSTAAAKVSQSTPYFHRRRDSQFAALWDEALATGYQRLEEAVLRYAMDSMDIGDLDLDFEPDGDPGEAGDAGADTPAVASKVPKILTTAEIQTVLKLLDRHRAAVEGRRALTSNRRYTAEETDAALSKLLDGLATKLGRKP